MLEEEHREVCQADKEEEEFLRKSQIMLVEEFPGATKEHPLAKVDLPRAQPCKGFMATHTLEYDLKLVKKKIESLRGTKERDPK